VIRPLRDLVTDLGYLGLKFPMLLLSLQVFILECLNDLLGLARLEVLECG